MVVGVMQVELNIEWAQCLKDKRRVVSSLKDRLHRHHQVSVAEVSLQDDYSRAVLGIAIVTTSARTGQAVFDKILDKLRVGRDYVLNDQTVAFLTGH